MRSTGIPTKRQSTKSVAHKLSSKAGRNSRRNIAERTLSCQFARDSTLDAGLGPPRQVIIPVYRGTLLSLFCEPSNVRAATWRELQESNISPGSSFNKATTLRIKSADLRFPTLRTRRIRFRINDPTPRATAAIIQSIILCTTTPLRTIRSENSEEAVDKFLHNLDEPFSASDTGLTVMMREVDIR